MILVTDPPLGHPLASLPLRSRQSVRQTRQSLRSLLQSYLPSPSSGLLKVLRLCRLGLGLLFLSDSALGTLLQAPDPV